MGPASGKYYNLKLSLMHSENTSSVTIFVTQIEINDNAFGVIGQKVCPAPLFTAGIP